MEIEAWFLHGCSSCYRGFVEQKFSLGCCLCCPTFWCDHLQVEALPNRDLNLAVGSFLRREIVAKGVLVLSLKRPPTGSKKPNTLNTHSGRIEPLPEPNLKPREFL